MGHKPGEKLVHFFSALQYFLSLSACEAAAGAPGLAACPMAGAARAERACAAASAGACSTGRACRRGPDWDQGPACSDQAAWTGWTGHHRPVPGPGLRLSTETQATARCTRLSGALRPAPTVCSLQSPRSVLQRAPSPAAACRQAVTRE